MKRIQEDNTYKLDRWGWIVGSIALWLVYGFLFIPIYALGSMLNAIYMVVIVHTTVTVLTILLVYWVQE